MTRRLLKMVSLLILMPLVLICACGSQGANFSILPTGQSFQGSITSNKVDILWVVDNSGSMLTKQQNLANSFNSFMDTFTSKNYDFRMAIVTTDTRTLGAGGQDSDFQGVITNDTVNFVNVFKTNIVVGARGDANAKALDAIVASLSAAKLAGNNTGFLRSDAHLAVIILSDADDNDSTETVATTQAFLETLKPDLTDPASGRVREQFTVSAVIDDQTNPGPTPCVGSEDGIKFRNLANLSEGSKEDICATDFSAGLSDLSEALAQFISQILLTTEPQPDTISVKVNGVVVPESTVNGWSYVAAQNKIIFHGVFLPDNSATVQVFYTPTDIIR